MKTLNRPMFNMGGPIKQGIMHGIREPYKHGTRAALVGNPIFPKDKTGRAHHVWNFAIPAVRALAGYAIGKGGKTTAKKGFESIGKTIAGKGTGTGITAAAPAQGFWRSAWEGDPMVRSAKWLWRTLKSPTAKGWGQKAAKTIISPTGALTAGWFGYPAIKGALSKEDPAVTGVPLNPNLQKKVTELSNQKKKEFALQQREDRVQKYLEMMGYDRAKKTAIADALIDASKIVSDRGTLDPKNITGELINPIIQATSKRLDKPEQIREAVGLMATKAEIEKDLEDPSIKALRLEQLKGLRGGFEKDLGEFILSAKGTKVKPDALERYARIKANEYGIDFTKITDETVTNAAGTTEEEKIQNVVGDDGIYMIGDAIIKVTDGVPKHIG